MTTLRETPLTAWHKAAGAKMGPFAGWDMPIQYAGILAEHAHTRESASVFDICHMGQFRISGPGSAQALGLALTHAIDTLATGKCRYGFLLSPQGTVLDDLVIYRLGDEDFLLVVNAACCDNDFREIMARVSGPGRSIELTGHAKIDLQGPKSVDVLEKFLNRSMRDLGYFSFTTLPFPGSDTPMLISRTGYTGELGYELYVPANLALPLWEALLKDERVKAAGLGARDTLRLESGLPLYGHEMDDEHSPAESGMAAMLKSTAPYVGHEHATAVRSQMLIPLRAEGRRAARSGDVVALASDPETGVGVVTSGSFAPTLNASLAFAFVDKNVADQQDFVLLAARTSLPAKRVSLPFYQGGARTKLQ